MTRSGNIIDSIKKGTPNHYQPLPVVLSEGDGCWVKDVAGKSYLDMLSCYSAVNLGYKHPKLTKAITTQLDTGLTACSNAVYNDKQIFNTKLAEFCGYDKALVMNTGAEAVETFIKLARKWRSLNRVRVGGIGDTAEDDAEIIVCANNFHGRTTTIISFSSELLYREGFGPQTPGFRIIPYGDIKALEQAINFKTAAFLVEPIQGEGGINIPPQGYLSEAKQICAQKGVLFALDEIQTGFGRTGKMFAWEHEDAKPDVLILGKSLGSYIPVSAVLADKEKMDAVFTPGTHGSTFADNPLACAIGIAVLEVFSAEGSKLLANVSKNGRWFTKQLKGIKNPHIKEVRGRGLFVGVELLPEAGGARRFCEALVQLKPSGIICKETHKNVIRFAPPLIIAREELEWAVDRIRQVLEN
ncbi:MAG: ornithine--oxo-acid transaminase [Candidatus Spechtbacteria bacterium RIFCSPHIGHO2_02_FULL_43_15b]|uniref:ornithine aminotransferase n=1 Tax=Candidatus Spechtbacteria bacterium RIFCSPHIGHO2_01_FULL_43_30 TaxID=1802158 RepID=A0A1G2H4X7_9BACT|nr:MAG: ornithine--oxo-acid transaminase [Candidatus Spechtbacteria bacterium RIFCSPHIGHO2_01_FULL_43_30]OGZ59343.1 MAG: ornithine--oxo-acid transaminase [Candidatus Spechtbacteria bacterium RIFCSPHIGHO2_02_FULL_43_15b]